MKKSVYCICLFISMAMLYFFERESMFYNDSFFEASSSSFVSEIIMFGFSFLGCILFYSNIPRSLVTRRFTFLIIVVYAISFLSSLSHPFTSRGEYITIILPLFLFSLMSLSSVYIAKDQLIIWFITFLVALLSLYYFKEHSANLLGTISSTTASYHILYFLPFVLCHKRKAIRFITTFFIFIIVTVSLKRGGLLALVFAIAVYAYVSQFSLKGRSLSIKGLVVCSLLLTGIVYLYVYVDNEVLGGLSSSRLESMGETGGSGRIDIYKDYLNFIKNDRISNSLTGHGWWGSMRDSNVGTTCHNDFLECFIDFGIIGFFLYISFIISLVNFCLQMIKNKHEYAPAMAASITMFLTISMLSHILIYPKFLMIFSLFWGFIVSSTNKSRYYNNILL